MPARSTAQRKADLLDLLTRDEDAWVASASATGETYFIPLSCHWNSSQLVFATLETSKTTRNLRRAGRGRASLPSTRDVVIVEGPVAFIPPDADPVLADAFAARLNRDPRREPRPDVYFALTPEFIQAWRDVAEPTGRTIMRDGVRQD